MGSKNSGGGAIRGIRWLKRKIGKTEQSVDPNESSDLGRRESPGRRSNPQIPKQRFWSFFLEELRRGDYPLPGSPGPSRNINLEELRPPPQRGNKKFPFRDSG